MDESMNFAPRCPYCGEEMRENGNFSHRWYMCPYCLSAGPRKIIDMTGYLDEELAVVDATQKAREATMQHWQEPNRVLSLSELEAMAKEATDEDKADSFPVWVEFKFRQPNVWSKWVLVNDVITWYDGHKFLSVDNMGYINDKELGHEVRCWLRKPTQEEMEDTPWETK